MEKILTDENFDKEINSSKMPVLVDFFATWCEPCSMLAPILERIAEHFKGDIVLMKANLDEVPLVAQKFGVEKIPTVILFKNGSPVSGFVGLNSEESIKQWLEDILKIEELTKQYSEYAKTNGFQLNPDRKISDRIINGLLQNEKKHGKKYCPCRRLTEDEQENLKKVCPCFWHKEEIKKDGHCFCNLYVK